MEEERSLDYARNPHLGDVIRTDAAPMAAEAHLGAKLRLIYA